MSTAPSVDRWSRLLVVALAVIVGVPVLVMLVTAPLMMGAWGGMMGYGGVGPGWTIGLGLVWLLVLVGGGLLVHRWLTGGEGRTTDPALRELRQAYARGDLTAEEYEERLARLTEG